MFSEDILKLITKFQEKWSTTAKADITKFWGKGVRARGTKSGRSRSRPYQLCAIVNHFLENLVTRGTFQFGGSPGPSGLEFKLRTAS